MRIDHVILATRDIDAAAARLLDEHGLDSVVGGRHPGWGTGNRIVPVGDQYLEIMGIVDEAEAGESPLGQHVLSLTTDGDCFMGWCVRPDDLDSLAARLDVPAIPSSRVRPDGVEVRWRLAGLPEAMAEPWLPFFISWDDMTLHPSRTPVAHRLVPHEIAWVEVGGDSLRRDAWLGGSSLPVLAGAEARVTAVAITTATGSLTISPAGR